MNKGSKHEKLPKVIFISKWIKVLRKLIEQSVGHLRNLKTTRYDSVLTDNLFSSQLSEHHDKFILTQREKTSNNIVFVCKKYYFDCLIQELDLYVPSQKPIYTCIILSESAVRDNHISVYNPLISQFLQINYNLNIYIGFQITQKLIQTEIHCRIFSMVY